MHIIPVTEWVVGGELPGTLYCHWMVGWGSLSLYGEVGLTATGWSGGGHCHWMGGWGSLPLDGRAGYNMEGSLYSNL